VCVAAAVDVWLGFELAVRVAVGVGSGRLDDAGAGTCVASGVGLAGLGFGFADSGVGLAGFGFGFADSGFGFAGVGFGLAGFGFTDFGLGLGLGLGLGFAGFGFGLAGVGFALFEAAGVARFVAVGVGVGDDAVLVGEEVGVARAVTDALGETVVDIPAAAEPVPATATAAEAAITIGIADTIAVFAARPFRLDPPVRRGGVWLAKLH
jgi:hypothetical protein